MAGMKCDWWDKLVIDGFALISAPHTSRQIDAILAELNAAFAKDASNSTLRTADGAIYGARNLLHIWPDVANVWRRPPLPTVLAEMLGPAFGLVRVLYFDKPPDQSWALPWHKDRAIAVENNLLPSEHFSKPTVKVGVPHVDAPPWLLGQMLTLRLHLDSVTDENGPLRVVPGSHRGDESRQPITILCKSGDVLAMRPLLSHCSNKSLEGTERHRRILHFEFAGIETLPDGYQWRDFIRTESIGQSCLAEKSGKQYDTR